MEFRTVVDIEKPLFQIEPCEEILFVGSCFADAIGSRFREEAFPVAVNPYGVMYNPASILHTLQRFAATTTPAASPAGPSTTPAASPAGPRVAFLTLGTNHVYRLKATGEIVDNCEKRPQSLFEEEELSVEACSDYLRQCVEVLRTINPNIHVVLTVSPIRYRKYGYHESQLSKATLLLAAASASATGGSPSTTPAVSPAVPTTTPAASPAVPTTTPAASPAGIITYFPAYELLMDELRDYRFYTPDMIHPSSQAVEYIWERLVESYFSDAAKDYLHEWHPIKQALAHKPFNPDSPEYRIFAAQTQQRLAAFLQKYPTATTPAASAVGGFPAGSPAGSSGV